MDIGDIKAHVADLGELLSEASIMEQRSFLRSFIKRIVVDPPNITIEYTVPLRPNEAEPLEREALPIASSGPRGGKPFEWSALELAPPKVVTWKLPPVVTRGGQ